MQLTEFSVKDLNVDPRLPYEDNSFDGGATTGLQATSSLVLKGASPTRRRLTHMAVQFPADTLPVGLPCVRCSDHQLRVS